MSLTLFVCLLVSVGLLSPKSKFDKKIDVHVFSCFRLKIHQFLGYELLCDQNKTNNVIPCYVF